MIPTIIRQGADVAATLCAASVCLETFASISTRARWACIDSAAYRRATRRAAALSMLLFAVIVGAVWLP